MLVLLKLGVTTYDDDDACDSHLDHDCNDDYDCDDDFDDQRCGCKYSTQVNVERVGRGEKGREER